MNALFASSGITQLERKYHFAMRGVDGGGKNGAFFYGDEAVFGNEIASDSVSLLSGSWYMAVSGEGLSLSLPWYQLYSPRLIGYPTLIVIILLFSIIYFLYKVAHTHSLQDELTKLPNRRLLMHSLEQVMQDPFPRARHFTLLNLDLNKFKAVNDTFGHSVGDAVLVEVAKRIKKTVRTSDLTARVGGDEFLIYLPKLTDENSVLRIIHALRAEIGGKPINAEGHSITLEASIGYTINLNSEANVDAILHAADINMYTDKSRQKNNP
jgi:diguanylate cyclase (GGDEF)-like protein